MNKRKLVYIYVVLSLHLVIFSILFTLHYEKCSCAGIHILSEAEYAGLSGMMKTEMDLQLLQNGFPAPRDIETNTSYISVDAKELSSPWRISAVLSLEHPEQKLYFAPDSSFADMNSAVKQGHHFKLVAVYKESIAEFSVVFTTLPVLQLSAEHKRESEWYGDLALFDPYTFENGGYSIASSKADWHVRGRTTSVADKSSYKITLTKENSSDNRNLSLLKLGEDDDWILNSMIMDDVKLREMVIADIWNSLQDAEDSALKMSEGEYVELIANGSYLGLYMLQRRVDNKYLGEKHASDVIVKGKPPYYPESLEEAWRIQYNPENVSADEVFDFLEPLYILMSFGEEPDSYASSEYLGQVNIDNLIDVNAFMSAFYMADNTKYNNMNYLMHRHEDNFVLEYIPWDVDMAFGLAWSYEKGFHVNMEQMHSAEPCLRVETKHLFDRDPALKRKMVKRWRQLRTTWLSFENIQNVIYSRYNQLLQSGALARDEKTWGLRYHGEDSLDNIMINLERHLIRMDACYSAF